MISDNKKKLNRIFSPDNEAIDSYQAQNFGHPRYGYFLENIALDNLGNSGFFFTP